MRPAKIIEILWIVAALIGAGAVAPAGAMTGSSDSADTASISGTVLGEDGGPAVGFNVSATSMSGMAGGFAPVQEDGSYSIVGLPAGEYRVEFLLPMGVSSPYLGEFYDDKADWESADLVVLAAGEQRRIDAELARTGQISGKVTSNRDKTAGDVIVEVLDTSTRAVVAAAPVGPDRTYIVAGLRPGTYVVHFAPAPGNPHRAEYYSNAKTFEKADPVTVRPGLTTPRINAELIRGR